MHYLYIITNLLDKKVYVGQSKNPYKRWSDHKSCARTRANFDHHDQLIHVVMNLDGIDNFSFEIIDLCDSQIEADVIEDRLIEEFNSTNPDFGYNVAKGGRSRINIGKDIVININIEIPKFTKASNKSGRLNVPPANKRNWPTEKIIAEYKSGLSTIQLAKIYNTGKSCINRLIPRNIIRSRSSKQ